MNFLMEFKNEPKKAISNIEYHAYGADGKVYGILKEGTKYYIKTTEVGKENIAESYDYINGFVNRRENEYKSYNDATKHLELKLMSLNEAYGKKADVSTVDFKRSEKVFENLTEEARKEINRMNQIIENSCKIGRDCVCDPESKGSASPENTEKNNDPFDKKVTPDMDYKGSKGTVGESTDGDKVSNVDGDLQSDKMKTKNSNLDDSGNDKEYKKTEDDLEGKSVAAQNPSGGKAVVVKVNEDIFEQGPEDVDVPPVDDSDPTLQPDYVEPADASTVDPFADTDAPIEEPVIDPIEEPGADVVGVDDGTEDDGIEQLEEMLNEFLNEDDDLVAGDNKVMTHEDNPINGTNNGIDDEKSEDWKRVGDGANIKEEDEGYGEADKSEQTETMDNYKFGYNDEKQLPAQSWDKMNESEKRLVKSLTESIYNKLVSESSSKGRVEKYIQRLVNEEITRLDAWGKHPKFGKEPMTTPPNKEKFVGTADRDWNDDSAKGEKRYGLKIGDGKPFDEKVVDLLTDQVLAKIKGLNN